MWRHKPRLQPDPVRNTLDETARRRTLRVMLPAVHHFMYHDPSYFVRDNMPRFLPEGGDVGCAEVDLLVVFVDAFAGCEGNAGK